MKIHTRSVFQMTDDPAEFILLEDESFEYDGPLAEAGGGKGGSDKQTTTATTEPSSLVRPYISGALPGLAEAFNTRLGQQYTAGPSAVAGFNPLQTQGQLGMLGYAMGPELQQQIGSAQGASDFALNLPQTIADNPVVQAQIEAAQRPLVQNFQNEIMPSIARGAIGGGTFGGSRQGLAEGLAAQGLTQSLADMSAQMQGDIFGRSLENQQRALALSPQTMQLGQMPSQIFGQVGGQLQGLESQLLGEQRGDWQAQQAMNDPMALYTQYMNTLTAPGFGNTSTSTAPNMNQQSSLASGLGGAITGGTLGSMIPGFGAGAGTLLGPAGLAGAMLGGALGLFG